MHRILENFLLILNTMAASTVSFKGGESVLTASVL
jgi:hypothetical protein